MPKFKQVLNHTSFLLVILLIISCNCGKQDSKDRSRKTNTKPKNSIAEDFLKQHEEASKRNIEAVLQQMEVEREKKQQESIEEEKLLIERFSKNYSLTVGQTESLLTKTINLRNRTDVGEKCIGLLRMFNSLINKLDEPNVSVQQNNLDTIQKAFNSLMPGFGLTDPDMARKMLVDLIEIVENILKPYLIE
ncbi:hypothetical protein Aasi_0518 [Candidatus Amoebophilus asiaticus 5a2]|uniref:Lipoprotein n=1 Tax=Amoebophilus asiaticus (strain 5a2) TaxID=452471 RepID=B3ERR9_AMOA5|nr:hypothetical protein [Candidatus Amoebophilus asiaticus]ACE05921.1 hypothetical protein Aasi_0518 [Candidatus Amoebophilus asiaticus 5a2]